MAAGKTLKVAEGINDRKNRNERFGRCGMGICSGDRGKGHPEHGPSLHFSIRTGTSCGRKYRRQLLKNNLSNKKECKRPL